MTTPNYLSSLRGQLARARERRNPSSILSTLINNNRMRTPPPNIQQEIFDFFSAQPTLPSVPGAQRPGAITGGQTNSDGTGFATLLLPYYGNTATTPQSPIYAPQPNPAPVIAPPIKSRPTRPKPGKQ